MIKHLPRRVDHLDAYVSDVAAEFISARLAAVERIVEEDGILDGTTLFTLYLSLHHRSSFC